jgi:hypothetical protein
MASELADFLLHEVLPYGAAAVGRIENKESAGSIMVFSFFYLPNLTECGG